MTNASHSSSIPIDGGDTAPPSAPAGPTPAAFLRALVPPAIGYAIALGGGVVGTVLTVLALVTGIDSGGTSGVDGDQAEGILFLLGVPFQLVGMSLFGTLSFDNGGVRGSVYALPLLLTALFVVGTAVAARRAERRSPTGSAQQVVTTAAASLVTAVLVLCASLVFAVRADGIAIDAASPGLFFGTFVTTFGAMFVGRASARPEHAPWRRLPRDVRTAGLLAAQLTALWIVVAGVALGFIAAAKGGIAFLIAAPLWAPIGAIDAYTWGHLSALAVVGRTVSVGEAGALGAASLVALGLLGQLLLAIGWHLRRDRDALDRPESWLVMPGMGVVVGLVHLLIGTVHVGGALGQLGGGTTVGPAVWTFGVLGVWGLVVEAASRYLAPSVAPALPAGLRDLLARGGAPATTPTGDQLIDAPNDEPAVTTRPMTPHERATLRRIGILALALVILIGGGLVGRAVVNSKVYGPSGAAGDYLDAIVAGDVAASAKLAPVDNLDGSTDLLTDAVYAKATRRVTGYEITKTEVEGDTATVTLRLRGIGGDGRASITLDRAGHQAGIFDRWRVSNGGLAVPMSFSAGEGLDRIGVGGKTFDFESDADSHLLLPGVYDLDPFAGDKWVTSDAAPTEVEPPRGAAFAIGDYVELPSPKASDALVDEVGRQLDAWLARCMRATTLEPDGCPQSAYGLSDARKVSWKLTKSPTIDFEYFDGTFPAELSSDDAGQAEVSYEYDASYGFGAPDFTAETDTSDLYVSATVRLDGDDVVASFE